MGVVEGLSSYEFAPAAAPDDEIACHICPSHFANAGKQPEAVYDYYREKCASCPHRDNSRRS